MSVTFLIGRIALVAIFLVNGILNLMDRAATGALIQSKFTIPASLSDAAISAQTATGMAPYELLAIGVSAIEIICALLIIFNLLTRFAALVLLIYTAVVAYFLYDLFGFPADQRTVILLHIALVGGLLMLFAIGPWRAPIDEEYGA